VSSPLAPHIGNVAIEKGNVKNHTLTRLESFVDGTAGKRLTYKRLTG
jgi:hypothetical protein